MGLLGLAAQYLAGEQQADTQGKAAQAQYNTATAQREAVTKMAAPTAQELVESGKAIQEKDKAISRQEALLNATDPALLEAGGQALKLLRGQQASVLGPIQAERDRQRGQLVTSLRAQMGEGAENTSAGQEALNRFDQQTTQTMASAQQSTLQSLLGTLTQNRPNPYGAQQANEQTLAMLGNLQGRQINALTGTSMVPYAQLPYTGQYASDANLSNTIYSANQQFDKAAGMAVGMATGNPGAMMSSMQSSGGSGGSSGYGSGSGNLTSGETSSLSSNLNYLQGQNRGNNNPNALQ